jgi:Tol biopolymer transport system component
MLRRGLIGGLCLLAALLCGVGSAGATAPYGPRLALARISLQFSALNHISDSKKPSPAELLSDLVNGEVFTTDAVGGTHQNLVGGSLHKNLISVGGIAWSPDGSTLALVAGGISNFLPNPTAGDVYLIAADGSGLRKLTRVGDASSPVFSSDGKTIYFQRLNYGTGSDGFADLVKDPNQSKHLKVRPPRSSIWAVNADGTGLRRITPTSKRVFETPTSVSPLTGDIAVSRVTCRKKLMKHCARSASLFSPATGTETVLADNASSPSFSPDGSKVALGSYRDRNFGKQPLGPVSELYVLDLGTGALQRLTYSPGIDESTISWDPSGSRLAYVRASFAGVGVREINADGSCATPIAEPHGIFGRLYTGVAWQPGAGRGAGPIAC